MINKITTLKTIIKEREKKRRGRKEKEKKEIK